MWPPLCPSWLAAALVIVVVGYLVAKLIARILDRVLERVGFDRMVERGGLRQVLARSKYDPSDIPWPLVAGASWPCSAIGSA
jgi:Conserved TM helix